jgi:Methyltransferase domain
LDRPLSIRQQRSNFRFEAEETTMVDEAKLNEFIGKILGDLGGAFSVPMVRMGDKLGLYKALREQGPMTPSELAAKTKVAERYAREWLSHQAASGYLEYDTASGKFALPPEQAMVFADVDSPVYLQGAFDLAVSMVENQPKVEAAFRSGKGVGWGDQAPCLFCTVGRFFRPGYHNNLVSSWLPALDGVAAKLESGAKVADVGCGHGFSTIIMAKAFPKSTFVGYDFHPESVAQARAMPSSTERRRIRNSKSPWRAISPAKSWISSPSSTACMTWAIRSAPRAMFARR